MTDSSGAVYRPLGSLPSGLLALVPRPLRNMLERVTLPTWKILAPATVFGLLLLYKFWRPWPFSSMGACFGTRRKRVLPNANRNTPTGDSPGYLGLRNEGSTCYLNSILQCLFMAPDFTKILSTQDPYNKHVNVFRDLLSELKARRSPPSTLNLMHCFGIKEGRQQDVEEHFRILINGLPQDIQQLFRIQMVHSLTCQGCKHEDVLQNPMLCLPLAITDREPSVKGALNDFRKANVLNLDNQCYCSVCRRKEDAISRHYFTALPKILVVHLKRYEIYQGQFVKISRRVCVPFKLRVPVDKSQETAARDTRKEVCITVEEETTEHQQYENQDSVTYTLFARCNHYGGLHGGHYTAEIMSFGNKHWYTFNDTQVTESHSRSEKEEICSDSAYLLMYYQEQEKPIRCSWE